MSKKRALKRLKKDRNMKKSQRDMLATFLYDLRRCTTKSPNEEWLTWMRVGGFDKGYFNAKNKPLIEQFEAMWKKLNDVEQPIKFYVDVNNQYPRYGHDEFNEEEQIAHRQLFVDKANLVMDKLMEAILGLEEEDDRREQAGKTYERGLPVGDLDEA